MLDFTRNEMLSLVPMTTLAIVYWIRDKYIFNRSTGRWYVSTRTQKKVLFGLWPLWTFLGWSLGLQTNRNDFAMAFLTTTGQHIVGHFTVVGILNDSFRQTRQQLVGFFLGLAISYIWTFFWLIATNSGDEVDDVQYRDCQCNNTTD